MEPQPHMSQPSQSDFNEKLPTPFGPYGAGSSRASLAPSMKSSRSTMMDDIRYEIMINSLFQQQCAKMWIGDGSGETEGIMLRKSKSSYLACPPDLMSSAFGAGIMYLNVPAAITINIRAVKTYLAWAPDAMDVPLSNGLRVQVLPSMEDLPRARKTQSAAFIASDGLLVVWDDGMSAHCLCNLSHADTLIRSEEPSSSGVLHRS